jgi:hypothetical protein
MQRPGVMLLKTFLSNKKPIIEKYLNANELHENDMGTSKKLAKVCPSMAPHRRN